MSFIEDLGTTPEDVAMLVVAYYLKAQTMGEFTKDEFITGFKSLGVDSLEGAKGILPLIRSELSDPALFREIFKFSFSFYKEKKDSKVLDLDLVDALLDLLLKERLHVPQFREFLKNQTEYKFINLDQWMNILNFSNDIGPEFEGYSDDGEWPVLFDLFVSYAKSNKPSKKTGDDDNKEQGNNSESKSEDN